MIDQLIALIVDESKWLTASMGFALFGCRSRFGHPHTEVVERLKASGAIVMTTGERGTISLLTDGTSFELSTFLSETTNK